MSQHVSNGTLINHPALSVVNGHNILTAAINIQIATGCRSCELLALTWKDVTDDGFVFIRSAKGGSPRVERVHELADFFKVHRQLPHEKVFHLSYRQLYASYLRYGIVANVRSRKKTRAVTHLPRHQHAQKLLALAHGDTGAVSHGLGHKSLTSQQHYTGKESTHGSH